MEHSTNGGEQGSCSQVLEKLHIDPSVSLKLCRDNAQAHNLQKSLLMLGQTSLLGRSSRSFVRNSNVNGNRPFSTQMVFFSKCCILPTLFDSRYSKRLPVATSSTTLNGKCCCLVCFDYRLSFLALLLSGASVCIIIP